jgi:sec-independent protein translocase protein TatC
MTDERRMTVTEHLQELRRVLIICLSTWLVATCIAFIFHSQLLALLLHPLTTTLKGRSTLVHTAIFTSPFEGFSIPLKISAVGGIILSLPVIIWQVWSFVSPGLKPAERKFVGPFVLSTLLLFAAGAAFAYFVMPIGLGFLIGFLGSQVQFFPDINQYLDFFMLLILIFGITFELPVVIVLLGALRIVSSRWLKDRRKAAWVIIILAAILITPGADPFTPTALAIPLLLLFELAVLIVDKVLRR